MATQERDHRAWATTVPGALAAAIAALAAQRLGIWFNLPAALLAVAVGLAAAALPGKEALGPGLPLWAKPGLRLGVAMMGAGVAWDRIDRPRRYGHSGRRSDRVHRPDRWRRHRAAARPARRFPNCRIPTSAKFGFPTAAGLVYAGGKERP